MNLRKSPEKRETSKGILLINHRKLGKCVILVKEKVNGKYGLLGGGINPGEGKEDALKRELTEEIGLGYKIEKMKDLIRFETKTQIHNVFVLKLGGDFHPAKKEIVGFAFYPLGDGYSKEREAIRKNMEPYAQIAVNDFRCKHDRKSYEVSDPKIEGKYFDQFHKELEELKKQIGK